MGLSNEVLETFREFVSWNQRILYNRDSFDENRFTKIKNYQIFYEKNFKPILEQYRSESEAVRAEMSLTEDFFKEVADYEKIEKKVDKIMEEREKNKLNRNRIPKGI